MRVIICLEFDGVDCDSEKADGIIESINEECETMQVAFDATSCWVNDAFNEEKEDE